LKSKSEYTLCNWCSERHHIRNSHIKKITKDCQICKGLWNQLDNSCNKIIEATKNYQYDTFLIGLTLDHSFYDNEDKFRSRFRIRGKENIKTSLIREIRRKFGNFSKKKIDLHSPDITINVQIGKKFQTIVSVSSSTLIVRGRYNKIKRFQISSKNSINDVLEVNQRHIEKILKREVLHQFHSDSIVFWPIGKEEPKTLVLGNGRPFYLSIKNSKKISFRHSILIKSDGILFNLIEKVSALPTSVPLFAKKVLILISFQDKMEISDLKKFADSGIMMVELIKRRRKNWKLIYEMKFKLKSPKKLELIMTCDNGLPVRRFIDGGDDDIYPTLDQILGLKCHCDKIDILDILNTEDSLN
jgi:tRNA pseudouridine synthase 10